MMADSEPFLFISHVSEDRMAAMDIVGELERRGISCWIAPRNIAPGQPFDDAIASALERCQAMLLIFSDQCNESEYIRREVTVAGENQKVVIPLRIEDAQPRRGLRIRLSDLHWLDAFKARDQALAELTRQFAPSWVETEPRHPHNGFDQEPPGLASVIAEPPASASDIDAPRSEPATLAPQAAPAAKPAGIEATATGQRPQTAVAVPPSRNYRAVIVAVGVLGLAVIAGAAWLWSAGPDAKPTPPPVVVAAPDALAEGKAAFERKDYAAAMRWDRQAADQGNATAQTYVGYFYENGLGVPQDYAEALRWYRKAADQGHPPAQKNIGTLYEQGSGVSRDYGEAMRWYRLAADQGNAGAQTNAGYLFEKGLGVSQSYAEALRWYGKAADQGEATAQNNIGVFYDKGYGVAQDYGEALRWYRRAANQGNIDAEYNLALLYADGHGVPPDPVQARQWMQKAADAGDPEAKKWVATHAE